MIHSWFEGIALKKQTIRSKYFDYFSSFVCPIANRSCCSLLIHSFLKSDLSDSLPLWQKSDQEQFAQVAHYKRAVGGIYSFSGANHSFALSLTKRSESVEKPLSEFPTLPVGNGRTQQSQTPWWAYSLFFPMPSYPLSTILGLFLAIELYCTCYCSVFHLIWLKVKGVKITILKNMRFKLYSTIVWSDLPFSCDFSKLDKLLLISYIFMTSIANFSFSKITETLNMYIFFENNLISSFYLK